MERVFGDLEESDRPPDVFERDCRLFANLV